MGAPLRAELGRGALSPAEPDASVACRLSPQNRLTRGLMGVMLTLTVLCGVQSRVPSSQPYLCVAAVRETALFKGCRLISSDSCLCLRSHRHSPDSEHIRRPQPPPRALRPRLLAAPGKRGSACIRTSRCAFARAGSERRRPGHTLCPLPLSHPAPCVGGSAPCLVAGAAAFVCLERSLLCVGV